MLLETLPFKVLGVKRSDLLTTLLSLLLQLMTSMSLSQKALILCPLSKGATNATVAAAGGNDTVIANLTLANSSIQAGAGDDSLSISVLSGSIYYGGLVLTALISAMPFPLRFTPTRGDDYITATGDATSSTLAGGKGNDSISVGGNATGGKIVGNSGADSITIAGTANAALVHGGAGNDSITVGAIVGGTAGGGLGADSLRVTGKVTGAEVLMSSKSDPNSSSDKADSLSVGGSMSNSTVYAGAGATTSVLTATWFLVSCLLAVAPTR